MNKQIAIYLFICSSVFGQQKDSIAIRYSNTINTVQLSKNLNVIASDKFQGRETGKKGQKKAAKYIAKQFKSAGIPPYKDHTYYQKFSLNEISYKPAEINIEGKKYVAHKDYYSFPAEQQQVIERNAVLFLGYGIQEDNYNDYTNNDVKGKVLMILSGEPISKDSLSLISKKSNKSSWPGGHYRFKARIAKGGGASALLIVVDNVPEEVENNSHRLEEHRLELESSENEMPIIFISKQMANDILGKNMHIEEIQQKISETQKPLSITVNTKVIIKINTRIKKISSENVLGYVEGSDLKKQLIVVTAHYDHLGKKGKMIFNGADDDGSGTVAVIALATAFAKAKKEGHGPRRSMLFMTVSGEEKGLLGSSYYADHPVYPISATVCDLNIDMIGRVDEKHKGNADYIYLIGSDKLSSTLHNISESINKTYSGLELDYTYNDEKDKNRFYYRSDHYNFAKKGIPVIFYFNGTHADYHKETDEVEKIDFKKIEKISRFVFYTAWELANRNERIVVDSNKK